MGILAEAFQRGRQEALLKIAGGPGSGVKGHNTATISSLPKSPYVSVGTRKALLDNMPYEKETVRVHDITHAGQDKFVPDKVQKFLQNPEWITNKPVDLLKVDDKFHLIDGHHRVLGAMALGIQEIPARVYTRRTDKGEEQDAEET